MIHKEQNWKKKVWSFWHIQMTITTLFHGFPFLSLHSASKMPH